MPTLEWIGKDKVINHHLDVQYRVLDHRYTYMGNGVNGVEIPDGSKIIRGDNLAALKSLLPQYEGRIKCIYIDPPYNTGNEGWVYNDNVNDPKIKRWLGEVVGKEGEDLSRHDKWLCMMYPRLKLLQRLLSDDGAIFISIDDIEYTNLKTICDEIFGLSNFVTTIVWQKKHSPQGDATYFSNMHDYVLVYAKKIKQNKQDVQGFQLIKLQRTNTQDDRYQNLDNDPRGVWASDNYTCNKNAEERPNLYYPIVNPNTGEEMWPSRTRVWSFSLEAHEENMKNNLVYWGTDGKGRPRFKRFIENVGGIVPSTWWTRDFAGDNQSARKMLRKIFNENEQDFSTPKPVSFIEQILGLAIVGDDIALDSFAGSGTTAHAVLNMNKSDGGNRKFILVEMMDYAESITAERVRRVIDGYADVEGTGGEFSFYDLGEPLLLENQYINENVPLEQIRAYVFFMETRQPISYTRGMDENPYYLGKKDTTAYYFNYEKERVTTLDAEFLSTVKIPAEAYVVYADQCAITPEGLKKYNITFKKIPRDIARL
ncbi:MAG: site-specific DNA-methyltransferase [Synergistaceae bacterium]|jgi:adenine-specific DNA-methyltransferase|nr:site-specific DNA-methyltransferase [Synergistaceae bacterium]